MTHVDELTSLIQISDDGERHQLGSLNNAFLISHGFPIRLSLSLCVRDRVADWHKSRFMWA